MRSKGGNSRIPFRTLIILGITVFFLLFFIIEDRDKQNDIAIDGKDKLLFQEENYKELLLEVHEQPEEYKGVEIEISGILQQSGHPEGMFGVGRYVISCCADHSQVVGLLCSSEEFIENMEEEEWIQVQGELDYVEHEGEIKPLVNPSQVEKTSTPDNPHIFY